jgi:hypothetical protein
MDYDIMDYDDYQDIISDLENLRIEILMKIEKENHFDSVLMDKLSYDLEFFETEKQLDYDKMYELAKKILKENYDINI